MNDYEYLLSDISILKGVGKSLVNKFKRKNINTIFDLILSLPTKYIDRSIETKIKDLHIGKIQTVTIFVEKYNFPRLRNLPNKVICSDDTGKLDCIFFNSYEGYIKKILPLKKYITISGKIGFFRGRYQITNPSHVNTDKNKIKKIHSNYSLTEGISDNIFNKTINEALNNLPKMNEWLNPEVLKKFDNISWNEAILNLHNPKKEVKEKKYINRLIFDEILSTFLINSKIRKAVKKIKKIKKNFDSQALNFIKKKIKFNLTRDQIQSLDQINLEPVYEGEQIDAANHRDLMTCLKKHNETDRTILAMLGAGHSYEDIQRVLGKITMANLRVKTLRARKILAECLERNS